MHVGCKCNVVIATCPQRYLDVVTTLSQPKDSDFVSWDITKPHDTWRI